MSDREHVMKTIHHILDDLSFDDVMIVLTVARTLKQIKDKKEAQP